MKTLKLILGFVLIANLSSFSQVTYDSTVTESKVWSSLAGGYGSFMIECCYMTTFVKLVADPSIGSSVSRKLVLISTDSLKTWMNVGSLLEANKKIYFRDLNNNQGLIYDFGATPGSLILVQNFYYGNYSDNVRVAGIDTVNYMGKYRKRFKIKYNKDNYTDYWIEGIGSSQGILNSCLSLVGGFRELLCVHENDTLIYQNAERGACYIDQKVSGLSKNNFPEFNVTPNPSEGLIKVEWNDQNDYNYIIYRPDGRKTNQGRLEKELHLNLPSGIYILVILNKQHPVYRQKIIMNK